jgi:hypothetical protein
MIKGVSNSWFLITLEIGDFCTKVTRFGPLITLKCRCLHSLFFISFLFTDFTDFATVVDETDAMGLLGISKYVRKSD